MKGLGNRKQSCLGITNPILYPSSPIFESHSVDMGYLLRFIANFCGPSRKRQDSTVHHPQHVHHFTDMTYGTVINAVIYKPTINNINDIRKMLGKNSGASSLHQNKERHSYQYTSSNNFRDKDQKCVALDPLNF